MSMHRKPLTPLELEGLIKHGLPIGTASQLSDCFRLGILWTKQQEISLPTPATQPDLVAQAKARSNTRLGAAHALQIYAEWVTCLFAGTHPRMRHYGRIVSNSMRRQALDLKTSALIDYDRVVTGDKRTLISDRY